MGQVYDFDKSFQERLNEYLEVFKGFEVLPSSELSKEWGFYLELTVDPNGWQAVWKISRSTCEKLKIQFPTIVLVYVASIDFMSLQASIRVIAVQDDIHIPEKHYVPLIQLWPTLIQDKTVALDMASTANTIDMVRFFYLHLFMPWDLEEEVTTDWKSKHLEYRLRLFYDMKNGIIPKETSERLESLLSQARRLQSKKEIIELAMEDNVLSDECNAENIDALADVHLKLILIRNEFEILENPLLRQAFMKTQKSITPVERTERDIWLIHETDLIENYLTFMQKVSSLYPNKKVTIQTNLCSTLENSKPNDLFILSPGKYEISTFGELEHGGCLKGIDDSSKTILISALDYIMFDFQVNEALIENVTINATVSQCAVVIRKGKVTFSNCKIYGNAKSSTHQGIIVLAGSTLELIDCEIYDFYTAIVGNSGSKIIMKNTEIYNTFCGLKIYDNTFVSLEKCVFRNCFGHGICLETENNSDENSQKTGDFDMLSVIPEISMEFVSGSNNSKGNVFINHNTQIRAYEDLFSKLDPTTFDAQGEEEMITENGNYDVAAIN